MKHPSHLFALIALATGIVASGLVCICAINGEMLAGSFTHEFQEQRERVLPSLAHADSNVTVTLRSGSSATVASRFDRDPTLIGWRPSSSMGVPMLLRPVGVVASLALSRTAGCQVAPGTNRYHSAVTATVPELRSVEADGSPLPEPLPGQVDNPFLVGTVATHCRLAAGEVRAEQFLFDSAVAAAKPVLADHMRNDGVLTKSLTSQIVEPFRACHLMSPWKEWLSSRTKNIPQHNMLQVSC